MLDPSHITNEDIVQIEARLEQRTRDANWPDALALEPRIIQQWKQDRYQIGKAPNECVSWDCDKDHWELCRVRRLQVLFFEVRRRLDNHELCDVWTPMTPEERSRVIREWIVDRISRLTGSPEIEG